MVCLYIYLLNLLLLRLVVRTFYKILKINVWLLALPLCVNASIMAPSPAPQFTYTSPICKNISINPTPLVSTTVTGFYQSTPAGLIFANFVTGQINVASSLPNTYTITNTNLTGFNVITITPEPTGIDGISAICEGAVTTLSASTTETPALLTWFNNGAGTNAISVSPTVTTTYSLQISDKHTCVYNLQKTVIVNTSLSNLSISNPSVCSGQTVMLSVTGTTIGVSCIWPPANLNGFSVTVTPTLSPSQLYTAIVSSGGCTNTLTGIVNVVPSTTLNLKFKYNDPVCIGRDDPLPALPSNFTKGGYFYCLDPLQVDSLTGKIKLSEAISGGYNVYYLPPVVAGCTVSADDPKDYVVIGVYSQLSIGPEVTITEGSSTILSVSGGAAYQWSPESNLNCSDCTNPVVNPNQTTQYCVLDPTDGCAYGGCVDVIVVCFNSGDLSVPNAFTPNGDNNNDKFCLQGWSYCANDFKVMIFNRWGEKVFESLDPNFCWDGTYNGQELSSGVYAYSITSNVNREAIIKKGNITLIR
jgi:gliding motility-associated-like protein